MFFNCLTFIHVPFPEDTDGFNQTGTVLLGVLCFDEIFCWEIGLLKMCFIYLSQIKYYLLECKTLFFLCCSFRNTDLQISPQTVFIAASVMPCHISFTNCTFILGLIIVIWSKRFIT